MKKLLVIFALGVAATVAHGAACSWALSGIAKTDNAGVDTLGLTAYLVDTSTYTYSVALSDFASGDFSKITAASVQTANVSKLLSSYRVTSTFGDYTAGDSYTYFTVIVNAAGNEYFVTDTKTMSVPGTGNLDMSWSDVSAVKWQTVPEPTSGLLLLCGLAGLALRRKRA